MNTVQKTVDYRRAQFNVGNVTLEELARQAWRVLPTQVDRTVNKMNGDSIVWTRRSNGPQGIGVCCSVYQHGQGVGTVTMVPAAEIDNGQQNPNPDENFVQHGFAAFIRGNHVVTMDCGRSGGRLIHYLAELFRAAGFPPQHQQFALVRVSNPDKVAMIHQRGVRRIDLKIGIDQVTNDALAENRETPVARRILGGLNDAFRSLVGREGGAEDLSRSERGNVSLSINVPKGDLAPVKQAFEVLAEELLDEENPAEYIIHLGGGGSIRSTEVSVNRRLPIERHANWVSTTSALQRMQDYMNELEDSGLLQV